MPQAVLQSISMCTDCTSPGRLGSLPRFALGCPATGDPTGGRYTNTPNPRLEAHARDAGAIVGDPTRWRLLCRLAALAMWVFPCNRTHINSCSTDLWYGAALTNRPSCYSATSTATAHVNVKLRAPRSTCCRCLSHLTSSLHGPLSGGSLQSPV